MAYKNYFQDLKIYFHDLIIYFQTLIIYFQSLKIVLSRRIKTFTTKTRRISAIA